MWLWPNLFLISIGLGCQDLTWVHLSWNLDTFPPIIWSHGKLFWAIHINFEPNVFLSWKKELSIFSWVLSILSSLIWYYPNMSTSFLNLVPYLNMLEWNFKSKIEYRDVNWTLILHNIIVMDFWSEVWSWSWCLFGLQVCITTLNDPWLNFNLTKYWTVICRH